ncbi:MAG TPA: pyridoxal-dependent decarboxylase, exosortase A system-associated [Povalibacter sp.]|nr:pyridoxal-dependent decarboxylase, exosortase A system-associated [Povalibacter sp.]
MALRNLPQHCDHPFFDVAGDCLVVGGMKLTQLAASVGRTPFYAYSREHISQRIAELRAALPTSVHLHYAMKANPMPAVVAHIGPQVDGLDVASVREMHIALDCGVAPERISFAGPGKTPDELAQAVAAGITLNVESETELQRLVRCGERIGRRPNVAIRVNPDFELKSSGMKMGGGAKQFGVDAERVPQMLKEMGKLPVTFQGFHIFSGSQNLSAASITEAQHKAVALAARLAADAPGPVPALNIGGGLGIPYFPGEKPVDLAAVGAGLHEVCAIAAHELPQTRLMMELGRYIVGEAGIYVCRIIDRKISRGQVFLITDGGLHHHLSASGNFGQVIRKNYPVVIGDAMSADERETVSVVGPLCTPLDLLADRVALPRADIDNLVVVMQSGAYGLSASPLGFLSHPAPAEVLI